MKSRREQLESLRSDYYRLRRSARPSQPAAGGTEATEERRAAPAGAGDHGAAKGSGQPEDTAGLRDIRPERTGGAVEARSDRPAPPRRSMEDDHFRALVERATPVDITCRDGYTISHAIILEYGTYSLIVQTSDGRELVFKHAIISVRASDEQSDE